MRERGTRKRIRRLRIGIGGCVFLLIIALAVVGPSIVPHPINEQDLLNRLRPPIGLGGSSAYPLGTDALGRDTLSRLVAGTRNSLAVAGTAMLLAMAVGSVIGLTAGYLRGWFEAVTMRMADVQVAFPALLLAIAIASILKPSVATLIFVLAVGGWVTYARVVRGSVLSLMTMEYILAAKSIGASPRRVVFRHIFPNVVPLMLVLGTFQMASYTISEATLSFLGLGIQPPLSSWGGMLAEGRPYLATHWWMAVIPGTAIMITVLAANLFSDAVRVWLDPRGEAAAKA